MATPNKTIMDTQSRLIKLGYDPKGADGIWGKNSDLAYRALYNDSLDANQKWGLKKVTWGKKFSPAALERTHQLTVNLKLDKAVMGDLMGCMAWETGETFDPAVRSPVSSATGLIQFMDATAKELGTTTLALSKLSQVEQLAYVEQYFKRYASRLKGLGDLYMAILWPAGIGKPDDYVLWSTGERAFAPNKGLDINADGKILRIECMHKVINKYVKGFEPANVFVV